MRMARYSAPDCGATAVHDPTWTFASKSNEWLFNYVERTITYLGKLSSSPFAFFLDAG